MAESNAAIDMQQVNTSCMIEVGSHRWHVRTLGTGPVCLLIHGTGASVHSWHNLAELLAEHYTVIMIDLPGHADTVSPRDADLSLTGMTNALYEFIESQKLQPELIIGHSAGAAIMIELCLRHPQCAKRLIALNAAVVPLGGLAGYIFSPLAKMSASNQWMSQFFSYRARSDRNVRKLLDSTGSVVDEKSFRRYAELFRDPYHVSGVLRMMANWHLEQLSPRLNQLEPPIHLMAASEDKTIPLRDTYKLQRLLPAKKVSVSVVHGLGHLMHEEDALAVARQITQHEQCNTENTKTEC